MLELANQIRRKKAFKNKWELYEKINKTPNKTIYELSKELDWTVGKVSYYIKKLVKEGLINNSTEIVNGRLNKRYSPKKVGDLINWDEMEHTERLK